MVADERYFMMYYTAYRYLCSRKFRNNNANNYE